MVMVSWGVTGSHITGLYIGLFYKHFKEILKNNIYKLQTPIVTLKDSKGKIVHHFMNLPDYQAFVAKNDVSKYKQHYYKGLGTWKTEELRDLVKKVGMDKFVVKIDFDEATDVQIVDDWLSSSKADKRKEYLKQKNFDLFSI
ncbi:MAG TPA: hypothetical protein PLA71_00100 [Saccharofermentans sp.]|nr:hypothetical protein [Saccharofermentans sp.]